MFSIFIPVLTLVLYCTSPRLAKFAQTEIISERYAALDKLNKSLKESEAYTLLEVTDQIMCTSTLNATTLRGQRKRFLAMIGSNKFRIGKWTFKPGGQTTDTVYVFRIPREDSLRVDTNTKLSAAITTAATKAKATKSIKETLEDIKRVQAATGNEVGKVRALAILKAVASGSVKYATTEKPDREALAEELAMVIASADECEEEKTLAWLDDLRSLNGREKNPLLEPYWAAAEKVVEMDGAGAHRRRHAESGGLEDTANVSYSPSINSLEALHKATMKQLTQVEKKVEGDDFQVPSVEWIRRQLAPSRETNTTAGTFTGRFNIKRVLQSRSSRVFHQHGQYCAQFKKLWRYHLSQLRNLFEDSQWDVYALNGSLPWYQCVVGIGQDDKNKIHFAIDDPKAATAYSKTKAFVSEGVEVKAADHDFGCGLGAHASVTSMYNIGKDPGMREFDISYQHLT